MLMHAVHNFIERAHFLPWSIFQNICHKPGYDSHLKPCDSDIVILGLCKYFPPFRNVPYHDMSHAFGGRPKAVPREALTPSDDYAKNLRAVPAWLYCNYIFIEVNNDPEVSIFCTATTHCNF